MDELTYERVTSVCARLSGRLSDDVLDAIRKDYGCGEPDFADATLLLNLAHECVGITREERDLIRSVLGDPRDPDLDEVAIVDTVPPMAYRFSRNGPAAAGDPAGADALLSAHALRHGGVGLYRAWREPLSDTGTAAVWLYVVELASGTDALSAYAGLSSTLWVTLHEQWPIEVVVEGAAPLPYPAAALAAARRIWPG